MPGAMDEVFREALFLNVAASGVIHVEAVNAFLVADRRLDAFDSAIPGVAHDFKNILDGRWRIGAAITSPGDVVKNCARTIEFGPHVDQHGVAFADLAAALRPG